LTPLLFSSRVEVKADGQEHHEGYWFLKMDLRKGGRKGGRWFQNDLRLKKSVQYGSL